LLLQLKHFPLWALIYRQILDKRLSLVPVKVKSHSGDFIHDRADELAKAASLTPGLADPIFDGFSVNSNSSLNVLLYFNNVLIDFPLRQFFKQFFSSFYFSDYLQLDRFSSLLPVLSSIDWSCSWALLSSTWDYSSIASPMLRYSKSAKFLAFKQKLHFDELPTMTNLIKRHSSYANRSPLCPICNLTSESLFHICHCSTLIPNSDYIPFATLFAEFKTSLLSAFEDHWNSLHPNSAFPHVLSFNSLSLWTPRSSNLDPSSLLLRGFIPMELSNFALKFCAAKCATALLCSAINQLQMKFFSSSWIPRCALKASLDVPPATTDSAIANPRSHRRSRVRNHPPPRRLNTGWLMSMLQSGTPWFNHIRSLLPDPRMDLTVLRVRLPLTFNFV
jgi:hypothetical protein